jgi:hypothetical protein
MRHLHFEAYVVAVEPRWGTVEGLAVGQPSLVVKLARC